MSRIALRYQDAYSLSDESCVNMSEVYESSLQAQAQLSMTIALPYHVQHSSVHE